MNYVFVAKLQFPGHCGTPPDTVSYYIAASSLESATRFISDKYKPGRVVSVVELGALAEVTGEKPHDAYQASERIKLD